MTKIWIALAITATIFTMAFSEMFITQNVSDSIVEIIDKTQISAKSESVNTEKLCGEIRNLWNSKKSQLELFLSHNEVDQIDISIEKLIRYCEQLKFENVYIECGVLKTYIEALKDGEDVVFHNIF